jgi:D-tyrosyl-tRNA(Tyr) deacylase
VKYYSAYLEQQVVGWVAEIGDYTEACWGYVLGDYTADLENVRSEAKSTAEYMAEEHRKAEAARQAEEAAAKALAEAHRPVAVLDIDAMQEMWDAAVDGNPVLSRHIEALKALPPATLREALEESVGDFFWAEVHSVIDTATDRLLDRLRDQPEEL